MAKKVVRKKTKKIVKKTARLKKDKVFILGELSDDSWHWNSNGIDLHQTLIVLMGAVMKLEEHLKNESDNK